MEDETAVLNLPKIKEARHAALALLRSCNISQPPITLKEICQHTKKSHDLTVYGAEEHQVGSKVDAVTKRIGEEIFIVYSKSRSVVRQRFSVAHELGHLYMGHVHGNKSFDLESLDNDEIEANSFAAHLLMPPSMLRADIKSGMKKPDDLAAKYQVSIEALWWQISKAGLLNLL